MHRGVHSASYHAEFKRRCSDGSVLHVRPVSKQLRVCLRSALAELDKLPLLLLGVRHKSHCWLKIPLRLYGTETVSCMQSWVLHVYVWLRFWVVQWNMHSMSCVSIGVLQQWVQLQWIVRWYLHRV